MPANAKQPVFAEYRERVPPDTTAQIFWLKNRRSADWRDKSGVVHRHTVEDMTDDDLARIAAGAAATPASRRGRELQPANWRLLPVVLFAATAAGLIQWQRAAFAIRNGTSCYIFATRHHRIWAGTAQPSSSILS
jgi:hypothetical protein